MMQPSPVAAHISDVHTWNPGASAPKLEFQYIDLSAVDQDEKRITASRELLGADAPSRARQLVRAGDVLVSTVRPNLNGVARVPNELDGATASTGFCVLRADELTLAGEYLFHWVKSQSFVDDMVRKATGASYPAVSDRIVHDSMLPLPCIEEQRRIAAILDQAEALRAKRRQALAKLDTLTQSLFLEMFGDPRTNPRRWPELPISDIGRVVTGNTPSRAKAEYFGEAIDWVKSDNINTPHYYVTRAHERLSEAGKAVSRIVPPQSILVTCIAGSPNCIGNAAMADREMAFNQQINAVVVKEGDPHFVYALVVASKHKIQEVSTKGMKGIVSKSRLERVMLPFPPLHLQRQYGRLAHSMENSKTASSISLAHLNLAVSSLQHRAFQGEL